MTTLRRFTARVHRRLLGRGRTVAVVGTRGLGWPPGGIERHCEQLYPRLARAGIASLIYVRSTASSPTPRMFVRSIRPFRFGPLDTVWCALLGILHARWCGVRVLHVHGIGPSVVCPLASWLRMRIVVRHLGREYDREKWGPVARAVLRCGERLAARYADSVHCLTELIAEEFQAQTGRSAGVVVIPNGAALPGKDSLSPRAPTHYRQFVTACRFEPEKGLENLLHSWKALSPPADFRLLIAGAPRPSTRYSARVERMIAETPLAVSVGSVSGSWWIERLLESEAFVLASTHEGMSLALLEAGLAGCRLVLSDIPANRLTAGQYALYFTPGDRGALLAALRRADDEANTWDREAQRLFFSRSFCWDEISMRIAALLRAALREATGRIAPGSLREGAVG